jgi:cell wall assembly regulator SMI1
MIKRLEAWLTSHRPAYFKQLAKGASDKTLARLEAHVGGPLPSAFKHFLAWRNGNSRDCFEPLQFKWQAMAAERIIEVRHELNELFEAGEFERENWWSPAWVPFLENGVGDLLVIDMAGSFGGTRGQVVEFWHDEEWRTILHVSFEAWLATFVSSLEAGLWSINKKGELEARPALKALTNKLNPGYPKNKIAARRAKKTAQVAKKPARRAIGWRAVAKGPIDAKQLEKAKPGAAYTWHDEDTESFFSAVKCADDRWEWASGVDSAEAVERALRREAQHGPKGAQQYSDEHLARMLNMISKKRFTPRLGASPTNQRGRGASTTSR